MAAILELHILTNFVRLTELPYILCYKKYVTVNLKAYFRN